MSTPPARGRIDKRRAVMSAAFAVFARQGYAQARVDEIAAEAGVAKATIYNHFGDKQHLLHQAVAELSATALADNLAAVELLATPGEDLRATLTEVGGRLIDCYCDQTHRTLRRLLNAEISQFPELIEIVHDGVTNRVTEALADRFARLTLTGRLDATEPTTAAEQFAALLTGPLESRSRMGSRSIPKAEQLAVAAAAVDTFLRAFASNRKPES